MTPKEYSELYRKFLDGTCTAAEKELVLQYKDEIDIQKFDNEQRINNQDEVKSEIYNRLSQQIFQQKVKRIFPWQYAAAACILFFIGLAVYNYWPNKQAAPGRAIAIKNMLPAGGSKARLILSNGEEIDLTKAANGTVYESQGIKISKTEHGKLICTSLPNQSAATVFNTISTPRGGEYQLVLQDGTEVWLNAASSLKFPSSFTGTNRKVLLTGEAYFEVAKDKTKPFSVTAKKTEVKVLGTHFNVTAYPEDQFTKTTLLEGAVRLSAANSSLLLAPGEQGTVGDQKLISKKQVNVEEAIAWKNGYFMFNKQGIKHIMAQVGRWYGANIIYNGNLDDVKLMGTVSRSENVEDLLAKLALTGAVNFKVEGKTIYVTRAQTL